MSPIAVMLSRVTFPFEYPARAPVLLKMPLKETSNFKLEILVPSRSPSNKPILVSIELELLPV